MIPHQLAASRIELKTRRERQISEPTGDDFPLTGSGANY
jgi:hypothetical protein